METTTEPDSIQYSGMEYLFVARGLLMWKIDSHYQKKDQKRRFFSIKGGIEVLDISGITQQYDSGENVFTVKIAIGGYAVLFETPVMEEADVLYQKLFTERFGFRLDEPGVSLDLPERVLSHQ